METVSIDWSFSLLYFILFYRTNASNDNTRVRRSENGNRCTEVSEWLMQDAKPVRLAYTLLENNSGYVFSPNFIKIQKRSPNTTPWLFVHAQATSTLKEWRTISIFQCLFCTTFFITTYHIRSSDKQAIFTICAVTR